MTQDSRNQTIPPKQIWLWINKHQDNDGFDFDSLNVDRIFHNDYNWKFYGRFAAALLADTEYVALYDDDTIPGSQWHENCLQTMGTHEGILGSAGIILKSKEYIKIIGAREIISIFLLFLIFFKLSIVSVVINFLI